MSDESHERWMIRLFAPRVFGAIGAVALASIGCREGQSTNGARRVEIGASSAMAAPMAPSPFLREGLDPLIAALTSQFGSRAALLRLDLFADRATVQVESSAHPGSIDEYEWRGGGWHGPIPAEVRGKGSLSQNLFPLSAIDWSSVPAALQAARARVDAENGKLRRVLVRRNLPQDESVGLRVYVDSPVRDSQVDLDARCRLLEAGRYP